MSPNPQPKIQIKIVTLNVCHGLQMKKNLIKETIIRYRISLYHYINNYNSYSWEYKHHMLIWIGTGEKCDTSEYIKNDTKIQYLYDISTTWKHDNFSNYFSFFPSVFISSFLCYFHFILF